MVIPSLVAGSNRCRRFSWVQAAVMAQFEMFFYLVLHIIVCNYPHMPTNLALDDQLIEEARRAGKHKTKKEAVNAALDEYVRKRKQMRILKAFGTVTFDPAYDYKAERRRRSRRASGQSRP